MIDSIFAPSPIFPNDRPLIPSAQIDKALNKLEGPTVDRIDKAVQASLNRVAASGMNLVDSRDIAGIFALTWDRPVRQQVANQIYLLMADGHELGGEHLLEEARSVADDLKFAKPVEWIKIAITKLFGLVPGTITPNSALAELVRRRALSLAGNFIDAQLGQLKTDLISAINPGADGTVMSRPTLLERIQANLNVAKARSANIARTELTGAYNRGRVATAKQSELVTHMRFLAISDPRTTAICQSRNGLVFPIESVELIQNTPPLHYMCRSVLSPVMPSVSPLHQSWVEDPDRNPENRTLVALLDGWR